GGADRMRFRHITGAVLFALSLTAFAEAQAQDLQPGMQTMMQQGGVEGVELDSMVFNTAQDDNLQPGMQTMMQQGGVEGVTLGTARAGGYGYELSSPRSLGQEHYKTRRHKLVGSYTAVKKTVRARSFSRFGKFDSCRHSGLSHTSHFQAL
ncbi:hypothetical protein, partial [Methylobacterium haplocladii]